VAVKGQFSSFDQRFCSDSTISGFSFVFCELGCNEVCHDWRCPLWGAIPVDLVKIFATYLCFQVLGGFFYVWDKKVVEMFIQDEIVPVLCLCGDRARYRRGRMDAFLTQFGAGRLYL